MYRGRTGQQITDLFEVDLHVRDFDEILEMRVAFDDGLEDLLRDAGDDASQFRVVDVGTLQSAVSVAVTGGGTCGGPSW